MDKVVSRQTHFKRVLEKQLDEIEVRQRQSETRRLKQIRDLGVDLTRIQKTTRDLEVIDDPPPRRNDQRRGSLPVIDSGGGASLYFASSGAPRSGRRLSCISANPLAAQDDEEYPDSTYSKVGMSLLESRQFQPHKAGIDHDTFSDTSAAPRLRRADKVEDLVNNTTRKSSSGQSESGSSLNSLEGDDAGPMLRRGSVDKNDHCGKDSNHAGHNVTTVFVHENVSAAQVDPTEAESQSMFELVTRRGRRASEPAVGGFLIRRLQANAFNDISLQRNSIESEELRKSIQKNLPSNIVAEEDEEERNIEDIKKSKKLENEPSSSVPQKEKRSSISENHHDGYNSIVFIDSKTRKDNTTTDDKTKSSKKNQNIAKTGNLLHFRQRRKSDGDVLVYSNSRNQASARNKNSFNDRNSEKNESWQSVRHCRYLRGYDPPEMKEPVDVAKFVFGPGKKDSLLPNTK